MDDDQANRLRNFIEWKKTETRKAVRKPMQDKKKAKARAKRKATGR